MNNARYVLETAHNGGPGPLRESTVWEEPFEDLEVDFTETPRSQGRRYLVVFVCSYSGRVEAYSTRSEKAREVARLRPITVSSGNGPAFAAETVQLLAKNLNVRWKLPTAYQPQSSGRGERMNRIFKAQLGKPCQETHLRWDEVLPMALLRSNLAPTKNTGLSLYEILYGWPPPLIKGL